MYIKVYIICEQLENKKIQYIQDLFAYVYNDVMNHFYQL